MVRKNKNLKHIPNVHSILNPLSIVFTDANSELTSDPPPVSQTDGLQVTSLYDSDLNPSSVVFTDSNQKLSSLPPTTVTLNELELNSIRDSSLLANSIVFVDGTNELTTNPPMTQIDLSSTTLQMNTLNASTIKDTSLSTNSVIFTNGSGEVSTPIVKNGILNNLILDSLDTDKIVFTDSSKTLITPSQVTINNAKLLTLDASKVVYTDLTKVLTSSAPSTFVDLNNVETDTLTVTDLSSNTIVFTDSNSVLTSSPSNVSAPTLDLVLNSITTLSTITDTSLSTNTFIFTDTLKNLTSTEPSTIIINMLYLKLDDFKLISNLNVDVFNVDTINDLITLLPTIVTNVIIKNIFTIKNVTDIFIIDPTTNTISLLPTIESDMILKSSSIDAFRIQNDGGTTLFNIDTINNKITLLPVISTNVLVKNLLSTAFRVNNTSSDIFVINSLTNTITTLPTITTNVTVKQTAASLFVVQDGTSVNRFVINSSTNQVTTLPVITTNYSIDTSSTTAFVIQNATATNQLIVDTVNALITLLPTINAATLIKSTSTTAFSIQNSTGSPVFVIDTVNNTIPNIPIINAASIVRLTSASTLTVQDGSGTVKFNVDTTPVTSAIFTLYLNFLAVSSATSSLGQSLTSFRTLYCSNYYGNNLSTNSISFLSNTRHPSGTAAQPSISFINQPTTGFYQAVNRTAVVISGTEVCLNGISATSYNVPHTIRASNVALNVQNTAGTSFFSVNTSTPLITATVPFRNANGSNTSPIYSFTSNTSTGMYYSGSDFVFTSNGTNTVRFNSSSCNPGSSDISDLGNSVGPVNWRTVYLAFAPIVGSDGRYKTDITPCDLGLNFIRQLNPVSYLLSDNRTNYGLIAQEVKDVLSVFGKTTTEFGGIVQYDLTDTNSNFALRYEEFISPMVKSVQELNDKKEQLQTKLTQQSSILATQQTKLLEQQNTILDQKNQIANLLARLTILKLK